MEVVLDDSELENSKNMFSSLHGKGSLSQIVETSEELLCGLSGIVHSPVCFSVRKCPN